MAMPGFAATLDPDQRWALIDFVRANNAGMALARGEAPHPVRGPDIEVTCRDGRDISLDQLRGQPLRIVAGPPPAPVEGLATIAVVRDGEDAPNASCVATDPAAWSAYAVVIGLAPAALNGSQVLIDPEGWLRAVWRPGDPPGWTRPEELPQVVAAICSHPIADGVGESDAHHH
jgi:hypothetical protein